MISRIHRYASSGLIGISIREIYEGVSRQNCPKDIIDDIQSKYNKRISYDKAWRGREIALSSLQSASDESYNALPSYCYVLK